LSYLANTQTDRQTKWQKHYLLGGGEKSDVNVYPKLK